MKERHAIPHVIHYCWFGGNPLGEKEQACIESWRRFFPNYQIIRWDESAFDVECCPYVQEAYRARKWAFVSDFARFFILYEQGGLYFDTDVEVVAPMGDIVDAGPFMGFEVDPGPDNRGAVAPGLCMGVTRGHAFYRAVLDSYEGSSFIRQDGSYDQMTVVDRITDLLVARGLEQRKGIQCVDGITLYPAEFFNPKDFLTGRITMTPHTRSIHHFGMSWLTPQERFEHDVRARLLRKNMPLGVSSTLAAAAEVFRFLDYGRLSAMLKRRLRSGSRQ